MRYLWNLIRSGEDVGPDDYLGQPAEGGDDETHAPPHLQVLPGQRPAPAPEPAGPPVDGVPAETLKTIMATISRPGGASAGEIGNLIGRSQSTAHRYLKLIAAAGHARMEGSGRGSKWRASERPPLTVVPGNGGEGGDAT